MEVLIQPDETAADELVARLMMDTVRRHPRAVLGLATGRTMEPVYKAMVEAHAQGEVDFAACSTFNLDEYIGLTPDHPASYRTFMNQNLFDHVNIPIERTRLPNGVADDIDRECVAYEAAIVAAGGIDLQLLGIGHDGHIGFNEPLSSLGSRTRSKALTPDTIARNAFAFANEAEVPHRAITMGVGTILDSRWCLMLVKGASKAAILAKAVEGPVTSMVTASALQLHPRCTIVVDEAAATELDGCDYYRWIWENEPEWAPYRSG
tara:strand:- start:3 stop:794 length:792 start_codon:yes stop_codon:yes gene_type:complete